MNFNRLDDVATAQEIEDFLGEKGFIPEHDPRPEVYNGIPTLVQNFIKDHARVKIRFVSRGCKMVVDTPMTEFVWHFELQYQSYLFSKL